MHSPAFHAGHLAEADGAVKPYVAIDGGPTSMVIVPGAGDGVRTCVDVAVYLPWFFRERLETCRLLVLSRREPIPPHFGVERHADDMIRTVEQLGYGPAVWECHSAAGPIGQWIAIKRPDLVQGLILSSSYDHVGGQLRKVLHKWLNFAEQGGGRDPFWDMIETKYRPPAEVLSQIDPALVKAAATPRGAERFTRILRELLELDQRKIIPRIACPTLVIGGEDDRTVSVEVQRQMAAAIPHSRFESCPGYGHFNDMENPAYNGIVARFAHLAAATHNSSSRVMAGADEGA